MPKASMHENHLPEAREGEVRRSRKVDPMQSKAEPESVRYTPNAHLGSSVDLANQAHMRTASFWREAVVHDSRKSDPRPSIHGEAASWE